MPIPWARLAHVELGEGIGSVEYWLNKLVDAATLWGSSWIMPNYEKEAETLSPASVAVRLMATGWKGNVGWSTQGWLPNGVDYSPITDQPVLLQIFPTDMRANFPGDTRNDPAHVAKVTEDCVWHARVDHKFTYVGVTWQTYDRMTPASFDCESWQHSTFPGNLVGSKWNEWYQ